MSLKKMKKDELELLSNKDIAYMILEERKRTINTADLFKKNNRSIRITRINI